MAELLIPEMPADLLERLLASANRHKRDVADHVLALLEEALRNEEWVRSLHSRKKRRNQKHIVAPASAEEISRGVGVTRKDKAIVRKVLTELGYIGKKPKKPKTVPKASARPQKL